MEVNFRDAHDARQTNEWGEYLSTMGWKIEKIKDVLTNGKPSGDIYLFVRVFPVFGTLIKVQHPKGEIPYQKIDVLAGKYKASAIVIEPDVVGYNENEYIKNGFRLSKLRYAFSSTIRIDLSRTEEQILKSFSENARRNIKKAQNKLEVKQVHLTNSNIQKTSKQFYSLYKALGKRKKFYVPSYKETSAKMKAFRKTSTVLFAYPKNPQKNGNNSPVAALWVGNCRNTAVYFHPGNTKKGYELNANYLLVWEAMRLAKRQNMKFFDFESAFDPRYPRENTRWKGYTDFKKKFGGEVILFPPSWIKFYNPVFKCFYLFGTFFSK